MSLFFGVLADQNHWPEWLNIHPASEFALQFWADQNHWQERLNMHPGCEFALQCLWRSEPLTKWLNMHPESEFLLHPVQIRTTNKNEHPSSKWVAFCLISTSEWLTIIAQHIQQVSCFCIWAEPLTRMAEHATSKLVALTFEQIRTTDKNGWTHIQNVSLLNSVLADQNHH